MIEAIFRLARFSERFAAYIQGKGYGANTIKQESNLVHKLLGKSPELVIDIGGNVGEYSAEIRRCNPNTEIHIIEPSVTNIQKLNQRFGNDKKITILPFAVSDIAGSATIFANEAGSPLGSLTQGKLEHFNQILTKGVR